MLVLSRQIDEDILIGDDIVVRVVDVKGDKERGYKVKIGVDAPTSVSVDRRELRERKLREFITRKWRH